jgi:hypothetical protein
VAPRPHALRGEGRRRKYRKWKKRGDKWGEPGEDREGELKRHNYLIRNALELTYSDVNIQTFPGVNPGPHA